MCRENGGFDNDCCALEGTASCAEGHTMNFTSDVCYDGGDWKAYSYYCYPPKDGEKPPKDGDKKPKGEHDPSKCRENGGFDNDCCALKEQASCADDFKLLISDDICWDGGEWKAYSYHCFPRDGKDGGKDKEGGKKDKHDPSKCRENGGWDNDCCALEGTASCADRFEMDFTKDVCYDGGDWKAYSYFCYPPKDWKPREGHNPDMCRENGGFDNDCCALEGTASCAEGFYMEWSTDVCFDAGDWKAYSYSCYSKDSEGYDEDAVELENWEAELSNWEYEL